MRIFADNDCIPQAEDNKPKYENMGTSVDSPTGKTYNLGGSCLLIEQTTPKNMQLQKRIIDYTGTKLR